MVISNNLKLIDKSILVDDTLIISDIHIGYEEALNKQGILVPRMDFNDYTKNIDKITAHIKKIDTIIINGDLKHEFGTISDQEWRFTLKFIDCLSKICKRLILIRGNHDKILGPIAKKRDIDIVDYYIIKSENYPNSDKNSSISTSSLKKNYKHLKNKIIKTKLSGIINNDILIIHGDKLPHKNLLENISTIIIGHEHPAISIKDWPRTEVFKCYLVGKWEHINLIVMPSFNLFNEGNDILKNKFLSPFLKKGISNFDVYIVADKIYNFGKVNKI